MYIINAKRPGPFSPTQKSQTLKKTQRSEPPTEIFVALIDTTQTHTVTHTLYHIQLLTYYYAPVVRMEITYASPSAPNLADSGDSNSNSSMATTLTRPVKIIPLLHPNTASSSSSSGSGSGSGSFLSALFSKWKTKVRRMSWHNWIELFLPCYRWIRTYKWREYLQVDLMSGTTVGVMLVPQVILLSLSLSLSLLFF